MPAILLPSVRRTALLVAATLALGSFAARSAHAQTAAPAPSTDCDRACLAAIVDAYYAALIANDARKLPQATKARITENGSEKKLADTFWDKADSIAFRFDIVNTKRGDAGTEAVIKNADGTKTMHMLRLKVQNGAITEIETIKANQGDADRLWGPDTLTAVSPAFQLSIREPERDSYYDLIAAADSYWRAFQTNGTPNYHRARLLPDSRRFENGVQTTGVVRDGQFQTTQSGFDNGRFLGRKGGAKSQSVATANDRLVAEFFAIKAGYIQEIQAVLFNLPDDKPTGWPAGYGPGRASAE